MAIKDYSKGKIYKIWSPNTEAIYIGSTAKQYLSQRLSKHCSDYKEWLKNSKNKYMTSYEILKLGNFKIELINLFPCSCIEELRAEEGKHQRINKCVNKIIASRTKKEYNYDNKEAIAKYQKEYYNKKEHKSITCECSCKLKKDSLSTHLLSAKHIKLLSAQSTTSLTHDTSDMVRVTTHQQTKAVDTIDDF
jgi:hypothetical protein